MPTQLKRKKRRADLTPTPKKARASRRRATKAGRKAPTVFHFDREAADRAVSFFPRFLRHSKGRWGGDPFTLEPWQIEIVRKIFGWKRQDGTRKYRTVYIEVPRKNGKSTFCAGLGAFLLYADGESGADIYSAAADRDQARIIFDEAQRMVEGSPSLRARSEIFRSAITYPRKAASWKALSADAFRQHGLNPHGILFDELHTQRTRDLYDTLSTALGARTQPLTVLITTAGYDRNSICWELHEYARKILKGIIEDDTFLPVIYAAETEDDWTDPKVWAKANPNLGVSISEEFLASECARAQRMPAYENTFRRLYLNQWTSQETRYIPMEAWDKIEDPVDPITLEGLPCYAGLDLSSTTDLTALVLVFRVGDAFKVLPYFWIPEDDLKVRGDRDHVPYITWAKQGLLNTTPGNVIDYGAVYAKIEELSQRFQIREIAFDRWQAAAIAQQIEEAGILPVPFGQGFNSMSFPTKELLRLVISGNLHHGGNPILRWMADNVVAKTDPAGNMKPDKGKSRQRIDGIVATIMGLDRSVRNEDANPASVYEKRGFTEL